MKSILRSTIDRINKDGLPLFEVSIFLGVIVIGWAEFNLDRLGKEADSARLKLQSQVAQEREAFRATLSLVGQQATNWQQNAGTWQQRYQELEKQTDRRRQFLHDLQSGFADQIEGLDRTPMKDALELPKALKVQEGYFSIAEHVEDTVHQLQTALTNIIDRNGSAERENFFREQSRGFELWISKQKDWAQIERLPVRSDELKEQIGAQSPGQATNALTKNLGVLFNEVERSWTNYLADALYVTINIGKPLVGAMVNLHADRASQEAEKLFGLAREARMNGKAVELYLKPEWQMQAAQRAQQLRNAIMQVQARFEANSNLITSAGETNITITSPDEVKPSSIISFSTISDPPPPGYTWVFWPLVLTQIGLCGYLIAGVYRRIVVGPLRSKLLQTNSVIEIQNKLTSFGELASGLAHEVRSPLTAIGARVYTLQKSIKEDAPQFQDTTMIQNEVNRVDRIVRDYVKLARPTEPKLVPLSAGPLFKAVHDLLAPQYKTLSIEMKVEPSVNDQFLGDEQQLKQVLSNLVKNAAESIKNGGTITLRARKESNRLRGKLKDIVVLDVEDTGSGISDEAQEHIYDPFYSTKEFGSGLGLSIAARIVDKHGGALKFDTQIGHGTTFSVVLPVYGKGR